MDLAVGTKRAIINTCGKHRYCSINLKGMLGFLLGWAQNFLYLRLSQNLFCERSFKWYNVPEKEMYRGKTKSECHLLFLFNSRLLNASFFSSPSTMHWSMLSLQQHSLNLFLEFTRNWLMIWIEPLATSVTQNVFQLSTCKSKELQDTERIYWSSITTWLSCFYILP